MTHEPIAPGEWHRLLLRLAGRLPDELISEARSWLAEGSPADVAQAVALAAVADEVPLPAADLALLEAEFRATDQDAEVLTRLHPTAPEADFVVADWLFTPVPIGELETAGLDLSPLDLTGGGRISGGVDDVDRAAIGALAAAPAVTGLWRSWRSLADGSPLPAPRRVFVLGVAPGTDDDDLPAIGATVQEALAEVGEQDPQVEVCPAEGVLPRYQTDARAYAALLWAGRATPPIRMARVFDGVSADGPWFAPDHPRIEDEQERARLLAYLTAGPPVLSTDSMMDDILDPAAGAVVPLSFRTDGQWIWTDAVVHYLERHALAPDADLLSQVRAAAGAPAPVDQVVLHRVLAFLRRTSPG